MPLAPGSRVGPYEVQAAIGAGGMGEVYRARDSRLGRDVAIKSLPDLFLSDTDRVARFEREAKVLASLNHPHIAGIYGLEESGGSQFLILELVDGDSLAALLKDRLLALTEALTIARQVADALHAAHEKGIIHRDLKPANIVLSANGDVKVLDFGLAKASGRADGPAESAHAAADDAMNSPTTLASGTRAGVILGTAAYMSPEQARGKPVDKRTDIWSFGCVLYELLAGRHPFPGHTITDTIAAILEREPDFKALSSSTPPRVEWLVRRCLEKDPKHRLHDIADARIELDEALSGRLDAVSGTAGTVPQSGMGTRERAAWGIAALSLLGLAAMALTFGLRWPPAHPPPPDVRSSSTSILLPEGLRPWTMNPPGRFTLSPDGKRLALVAVDGSGRTLILVRSLDTAVTQALSGTTGATFPFWSPDSRFIAFIAQGKLKKIDAAGGQPITLCDASIGTTGAWNKDNVILFTPKGGSPLYRVSAEGGTPAPATTLDAASGDIQHWYPFFLPDGRHFLYFAVGSKTGGATDARAVMIGSLDSTAPGTVLMHGGSNAKYANGFLFFSRDGALEAQRFDADHLTLEADPMRIVDQVQTAGIGASGAAGAFTVSENGLLAYQSGFLARSQLAWFDVSGKQTARLGDVADYADVALSPDGSRAAVSVMDPALGNRDVWIVDVARGIRERFTFDPGDDFAPIWSRADGRHIAFSAYRARNIHLYRKLANGTGPEELLVEDALGKFASDWSADGKHIVYVGGGGIIARSDLWMLPLPAGKAFPFLQTAFVETHGQFSPDGRWLAYTSRESGESEVYVAAFPGPGGKVRISTGGGGWPRWRRDGKQIFYIAPDDTLTAVVVDGQGPAFEVKSTRSLFKVRARSYVRLDSYPYDVSADGRRFLVNTFVEEPATAAITLVVNWTSWMKK